MSFPPAAHLNNGLTMPILGLRTWQTTPGEAARTVEEAIKIGYRHFDCSGLNEQETETEVGEKLWEAIEGGDVSREELFISAKLPCTWNEPAVVRLALETTLKRLKLDYLDMYSMELPISVDREHFRALSADKKFKRPKHPHTFFHDIDPLHIWKELELLVDEVLVKSIGLGNFNQKQVQNILDNCRIKPANLEIELHPYLPQSDLVSFCRENGVSVTAFAPLGSSQHHSEDSAGSRSLPDLLEEPILKKIGDQYGKSPAQVVLHWLVQQNIGVLPRAERQSDLREDYEIFDFNLNNDDLQDIAELGKKHIRYYSLDYWSDAPNYPWTEELNNR